jgi:hypothetical protein
VASGTPRRKALGTALGVEPLGNAIDPAEAERLLDSVEVAYAWSPRLRIVVDKPDRQSRMVVIGESGPPCGPVGDV